METSLMPYTRTRLKTLPVSGYLLFTVFLFFCIPQNKLHAQATPRLSVQGILKKANGDAVNDDTYTLTFRLYTSENQAFNAAPWKEEQQGVEVVNGIYSTVLGNTTPLPSFNQQYFLGVTVGPMTNTSEMLPRVQLTSAPYALSIIGVNNQFPSSGQVIADSLDVNGTLVVNGNVLARSGAPGANGASKNGYGFLGDKDSGLYSTAAGEASVFVNNAEIVEVKPALVDIKTDATVDNLNLKSGGTLSYNGLDDWRLVETDYFETDEEDWKTYEFWNDGTGVAASIHTFPDAFAGKALLNATQNHVFKKKFTLPGSSIGGTYTFVKVKFKYFFLDEWDLGNKDMGYAGFSKTESLTECSVGWASTMAPIGGAWALDNSGFHAAANFNTLGFSDHWTNQEMTARYPSGAMNTDFWVFFGFGTNESPANNEHFAVGMIEIWVK